jgi:hypothetical protein
MQSKSEKPKNLRALGNRLTGGGLRALAKNAFAGSARRVMNNPVILSFGRALLKPFPDLTSRLYRLASEAGPSNRPADSDALSASARIVYERLQAASAACDAWNRTK